MEETYLFWLGNLKGISGKQKLQLLELSGSAKELYKLSEKQTKAITLLNQKEADLLCASKKVWDLNQEYEKLKTARCSYVTITEKAYPEKLKQIPTSPFGIYYRGSLPKENVLSVAIVGARMCSESGRRIAKQFGSVLAKEGIQVISGLARGIDGCAQRGTVYTGGRAFGVLGCGVDICYPRENIELYMEIQKKGGLISEYPVGTPPIANHFPVRNRLISGLSDAVLVIEAKERSGSLITADMALDQGKDVYAIPGRITDPLSGGCNRLIKQGAGVILSVEDMLEELSIHTAQKNGKYTKLEITLETKENMVYSCLGLEPKNLNEIVMEVSLSVQEVTYLLFQLQTRGLVIENRRNFYSRTT